MYARQNDDKGIGRTFVATRGGDFLVLGYYTLRSGAVAAVTLPEDERRRLPGYPVPVVHLGRLAVDRAVQGSGLGETLLVDALRRSHATSGEVAAYAVEVVAISEAARSWYVKYGFREMRDDRLHLYLSMKVIVKLIEAR